MQGNLNSSALMFAITLIDLHADPPVMYCSLLSADFVYK